MMQKLAIGKEVSFCCPDFKTLEIFNLLFQNNFPCFPWSPFQITNVPAHPQPHLKQSLVPVTPSANAVPKVGQQTGIAPQGSVCVAPFWLPLVGRLSLKIAPTSKIHPTLRPTLPLDPVSIQSHPSIRRFVNSVLTSIPLT